MAGARARGARLFFLIAMVQSAGIVWAGYAEAAITSKVTLGTTQPGKRIIVPVHITDSRIIMWTPDGLTGIPRGTTVTFYVVNVGARDHDFSVQGKRTPILARGQHAQFVVTFLRRGRVPFRSTIDSRAGFQGLVDVF